MEFGTYVFLSFRVAIQLLQKSATCLKGSSRDNFLLLEFWLFYMKA